MAAERSGAGGAGSAATAAPAKRPFFLLQSLADRRAEVEAWSAEQADKLFRRRGHEPLGLSGADLWNVRPAEIPQDFVRRAVLQLTEAITALRAEDDTRLHAHGRRAIDDAVEFVRRGHPARFAAANAAHIGGVAAASPSTPAAAAASSSSVASAKRTAHPSALLPAKRARASTSASAEHRRRQVHPATAASSSSAAPSTALFRELPSSSNDPTPRVMPLRVGSLPQEWFVDDVPDELICCICMDVARDPPNLEACGHAVCRECLTKHQRRSTNCPVCRQSFEDSTLASQPFVQSMVWRLRVRCLQHGKGCEWQGQLGTDWRNLKAHDAVCPFKEAICRLCDKVCTAAEKPNHPKSCPMRMVECASCQLRLQFCNFADHQPASQSAASMGLTVGKGVARRPAGTSAAASAAVNKAQSLLPPIVPPCNASEACPRSCEDPNHPGRVSVYLRSQRLVHERTCTQQPVLCTLCDLAHSLTPRQLAVHVRALWDHSQRGEFAQQQVVKMLVQRSGHVAAPASSAVAASSSAAAAASSSNRSSASSSVSPAALRAFRDGLKVGDLVDFKSSKHDGWFVGEVAHITKASREMRSDQMQIRSRQFGDLETVARDNSKLRQPFTKSPQAAAAAVAGASSSSSAGAVASVRNDGQIPADRWPPSVLNFGFQLRVGDLCDCMDTELKWRLSQVIGSDATRLFIHYVDWSSNWDEWIPKSDARIQPPRTRTEGYTGPPNKKPA